MIPKGGENMLSDPCYDKAKVLTDLSSVCHFVKKHALPGVKNKNLPLSVKLYEELAADLEKYVEKFRQAVEGLSQEGKFK